MNERIKEVRAALGLTRQAFGEKLGCSGDVINNAERGRAAISDMFIMHLCQTFSVNEQWLRSGEGEMFLQRTLDDEIALFATKVLNLPNDDPRVRIMRMLSQLPQEDWHAVTDMLDLLDEQKKSADSAADNNVNG